MKKLYTLLLATLISYSGFGTHLMGGEMIVEHLNGTTYVIHFQAYRDTIGIPFAMSATFTVYDNAGNVVLTSTVSQLPSSGVLLPGYPYGIEVYYFHDTISVPGPGEYTVAWWNCCRNGAIQNLLDPLAENMYLSTKFTNVTGVNNSTPEFLAPPVTYLPINQPWQYNSLPFDVNGDSLVWTIDTPLTSYGTYAAGWVTPSAANAADAFTIDAVTGQIDWTPDMLGNFVASILVEEYNNGTKIGEIRRDYQMIVVPDTNKCPRISNFDTFPVDANGHAYMDLAANKSVNVILIAEDIEGDQIEFLAYGEPFLVADNPAQFYTQGNNINNSVTGTFSWTPDNSQVRKKPYIVVFRTRDQVFTFDETVLFYVNKIEINNEETPVVMGDVYPSPAVNFIFVPVVLQKSSNVRLTLFTVDGKKLSDHDFGQLGEGSHLKEVVLNVSSGTYFVNLMIDGNNKFTKQIVVTKD